MNGELNKLKHALPELVETITRFMLDRDTKVEQAICKLIGVHINDNLAAKTEALNKLWAQGKTVQVTYKKPVQTEKGWTFGVEAAIVDVPGITTPDAIRVKHEGY